MADKDEHLPAEDVAPTGERSEKTGSRARLDGRVSKGGKGRGETPAPAATASRALDVFGAVADAASPPSITELMAATGLPKPTLHRMLQVLSRHGFVQADPARRTYGLGARIHELTHRMAADIGLPRAAEGELLRLSALTGLDAHLGALRGSYVVYLSEPSLAGDIQRYYAAERHLPVYCTAVGKAILAHIGEGFRERLLERLSPVRYTRQTITGIDALRAALADIRVRGFAVDDGEMAEDLRCVAAPVFDASGTVIAAVGLSADARRHGLDAIQEFAAEVVASAGYISRNLGVSRMQPSASARAHPPEPSVSVALPATAFLGEGPIWSDASRRLAWVDILGPAIHVFDPASARDRRIPVSSMVTSIAFAADGGMVAALQNAICAIDVKTGRTEEIARPADEPARNRFNDGRVDPAGRYWIGSMSMVGESQKGALFRLGTDGTLSRMLSGIGTANGLGWSPDGQVMYFTDTTAGTIYAFDFDASKGEIENRRLFARIPEDQGRPDGLAVDAEGRVWSAHWDGWRLTCYAPDGRVEHVVGLPVPRPTSCAFGGVDRKTLYVTTARVNMTAAELGEAPLSGSLLSLPVEVPGQIEVAYAGPMPTMVAGGPS